MCAVSAFNPSVSAGIILKGLDHSAQGCEARATLGVWRVGASTLQGLYLVFPAYSLIPGRGGENAAIKVVMQPFQ